MKQFKKEFFSNSRYSKPYKEREKLCTFWDIYTKHHCKRLIKSYTIDKYSKLQEFRGVQEAYINVLRVLKDDLESLNL